jgi:hypothetical protein
MKAASQVVLDNPNVLVEWDPDARCAQLELFIQPDAGHAMNYHPTAPLWYAAAIEWVNRKLGG